MKVNRFSLLLGIYLLLMLQLVIQLLDTSLIWSAWSAWPDCQTDRTKLVVICEVLPHIDVCEAASMECSLQLVRADLVNRTGAADMGGHPFATA